MKTENLVLKPECTGCRLCESVCPKGAIKMKNGELGVSYPEIDEVLCIDCGLCLRTCPVEKSFYNDFAGQKIFAAINKDKNYLLSSASGGVFSALALKVFEDGGIVYGSAMVKDEQNILSVKHLRIDQKQDLHLLQGSKYVQSDMSDVYHSIKADVKTGKTILFSGTPCQVAAVKSLCGTPENLILVEVICHGVPSQQLFTDYLKTFNEKGSSIESFKFRIKETGWGLCAQLVTKHNNKITAKRIPCNISSYYKMFLRCETYRDSCYNCKYATNERVADLTIGDFWGVEKDTATYSKIKAEGYDVTQGVSCIVCSTEKGMQTLLQADLELIETDFESISRENGQLVHPSNKPANREAIIDIYNNNGYNGLDKKFNKELGIRKYLIIIKNKIPPKARFFIKKILKR